MSAVKAQGTNALGLPHVVDVNSFTARHAATVAQHLHALALDITLLCIFLVTHFLLRLVQVRARVPRVLNSKDAMAPGIADDSVTLVQERVSLLQLAKLVHGLLQANSLCPPLLRRLQLV